MTVLNNVDIEVYNKESKRIMKHVKTHNKATRKMVTGLLRFIEGQFTPTILNPNPQYSDDYIKQFIPCYFNCGHGGVVYENGEPVSISVENRIPQLESDWTETVDYSSTHMVSEFSDGLSVSRSKIRYQNINDKIIPNDTLDKSKIDEQGRVTGDMDSVCFQCIIPPNQLNATKPVYVSELGLFSGDEPYDPESSNPSEDLLAYVKLSNIPPENTSDTPTETNVLYVRPDDTVIVKWVITIAAIGKDNILHADIKDESGQPVISDIVEIPSVGPIDIIVE
jgi:hypothetical protein